MLLLSVHVKHPKGTSPWLCLWVNLCHTEGKQTETALYMLRWPTCFCTSKA